MPLQELPELTECASYLTRRPRRNRASHAIRRLVQETRLHPSDLVAPIILIEGKQLKEEVQGIPGFYRYSLDMALQELHELAALGVQAVDVFAVTPQERKDARGSFALASDSLLIQALQTFKKEIPEMCLMVDIALDPFTDHGHDGVLDSNGEIHNDETIKILGLMSCLAAEAGADVVAPSDMMDGRVGYIRHQLDREGFSHVSILSYAAKYASSFYGPFRSALGSTLRSGDKKTYQLNPANCREAMVEIALDELEGADMLMIKPALAYLDILVKAREQTDLPLAAYQVSGEYAMIAAAEKMGWLDGESVLMESLLSIKRAGADFILTYGAKKAAALLNS